MLTPHHFLGLYSRYLLSRRSHKHIKRNSGRISPFICFWIKNLWISFFVELKKTFQWNIAIIIHYWTNKALKGTVEVMFTVPLILRQCCFCSLDWCVLLWLTKLVVMSPYFQNIFPVSLQRESAVRMCHFKNFLDLLMLLDETLLGTRAFLRDLSFLQHIGSPP